MQGGSPYSFGSPASAPFSFGTAPFGNSLFNSPPRASLTTTASLFPTAAHQEPVTWTGSASPIHGRDGYGELIDRINGIVSHGRFRNGTPIGQWRVFRQGRLSNIVEHNDQGVVTQVVYINEHGHSSVVFPVPPPQPPITFGFNSSHMMAGQTPQ